MKLASAYVIDGYEVPLNTIIEAAEEWYSEHDYGIPEICDSCSQFCVSGGDFFERGSSRAGTPCEYECDIFGYSFEPYNKKCARFADVLDNDEIMNKALYYYKEDNEIYDD